MPKKSFNIFKKDLQTTIDELQRKACSTRDDNTPWAYSIGDTKSGKFLSELESLHASHIALSEAFHNIQLLQHTRALKILDTKKGNTLKEDRLIELAISLSSEVNNLQSIIQTLEQRLKLMGKKEIREKTFS